MNTNLEPSPSLSENCYTQPEHRKKNKIYKRNFFKQTPKSSKQEIRGRSQASEQIVQKLLGTNNKADPTRKEKKE